jgi:transcriptional regulator with XRE-family HTH domain
MAKRRHTFAPQTLDTAALLGLQIREARTIRGWTLSELAERTGVSVGTMRSIERGEPTVGLGVTLEAATLVGVPLFFDDAARLAPELAQQRRLVSLLPRRVYRPPNQHVDDDF